MAGDDEKIKSALEIALEKAEKLGAPSEEEKLEARREKLTATAEALARRYLNGLPLRDTEVELAKLPAGDTAAVRQHLKSHLLEAIDIESPVRTTRLWRRSSRSSVSRRLFRASGISFNNTRALSNPPGRRICLP